MLNHICIYLPTLSSYLVTLAKHPLIFIAVNVSSLIFVHLLLPKFPNGNKMCIQFVKYVSLFIINYVSWQMRRKIVMSILLKFTLSTLWYLSKHLLLFFIHKNVFLLQFEMILLNFIAYGVCLSLTFFETPSLILFCRFHSNRIYLFLFLFGHNYIS